MQKGFLDTALRVTAMASMVIVTLCVASFGLSQLQLPHRPVASNFGQPDARDPDSGPGQSGATGANLERQDGQARPAGPDPLAEHLDKLGKRLDEIASTVSRERSTQSEIARLADSMQAVRQQADLSGTRLQQELGNFRVSSEVELRDLNRQVGHVSEKSQQLEREMIEHRAGILSALENQRSSIESQVARLEGGLNEVHSELSDLRSHSQSTLVADKPARIRSFGSQTSLSPVPMEQATESTTNASTWKEPVVLDSSTSASTSGSAGTGPERTATSTGWKVSPMSHSVRDREPHLPAPASPRSLPQSPPATEPAPAPLPSVQEPLRRTSSSPIRAPLKSTLAPMSAINRPQRVPEIMEISHADELPQKQAVRQASSNSRHSIREFDVETTVIHVAASRPVDVEPAGVRMLNPELSTTAYGLPWTHDAVTHELLRKISLRTEASIAGRQRTTINSDGAENLSIGSSCPHCNEIHGFESGDRLILTAGSATDKVQRFHVTSEVARSGGPLESIPDFDLTPLAGRTYVISEEAIEGTVEEAISTDEKLVPIHGVLTPVSGPLKTRVTTQLMQRLVVMTFRERNTAPTAVGSTVSTATGDAAGKTKPQAPLVLPAPKPAQQPIAKQLTPVKKHPVFLPPPAPVSALRAPAVNSNVEFVTTNASQNLSPKVLHAGHQTDDKPCEICEQKHGQQGSADAEEPAAKPPGNSFLNWFRRVRGESSDSEELTTADFQIDQSESDEPKTDTTNENQQRRYVVKPGNRRAVR